MMADDSLTLTEAGALLGLSRERMNQLVLQKRIKTTRTTPPWLIERAEVEAFRAVPRPPGNPNFGHKTPA
jgi:excisionase family DNA binding protein